MVKQRHEGEWKNEILIGTLISLLDKIKDSSLEYVT